MKAKLSEQTGRSNPKANMKEIAFEVERDEENGWMTASWDAPRGQGGITTQGKDLRELEQNVREAVRRHKSVSRLCVPGQFHGAKLSGHTETANGFMATLQEQYDDAMFDFSTGDYDSAIAKFRSILGEDPNHFDAQLSIGMAYYRKGEYATAIAEGHKAEKLRPNEQLVHTNLSLFYMKAGDKKTAEHHGLQARIASWKGNPAPPEPSEAAESELKMAENQPTPMKLPTKFPDMPWKKKKV